MSLTGKPSWDDSDAVQEFFFDGVYAGIVPEKEEDARTLKRQPKRRGLWLACFAQPRADESASTSPSRSKPSRLRLTARQLEYRRIGSPEARHLPLSDIQDVQVKWIQAGGVRVSKVTVALESCKEVVVIRGLKNPEELMDAVKKRQQAALEHLKKLSYDETGGRACTVPDTHQAGDCGGAAASPRKRLTARALFADATGSPASAVTSGCGSMTLLSAFARSPAQDFAGAESVAREIQLASPREDSSSYCSSEASDSAGKEIAKGDGTQPPAAATMPASNPLPGTGLRVVTVEATAPPQQPSDSFDIPVTLSLSDMAPTLSQASGAPMVPKRTGPSDTAVAPTELRGKMLPSQDLPQGSVVPFSPRAVEQDSPSSHRLSHGPLSPSSPHDLLQLDGGSPPPLAEDSILESKSPQALVNVAPHVPGVYTAGGGPPPVPEDSVVHGGVPSPFGFQSCESTAEGSRLLSRSCRSADLSATASLAVQHSVPAADSGKDTLTRSSSASGTVSAVDPHDDMSSQSNTPACLTGLSFALRAAAEGTLGSREQVLELPAHGAGLDSSSPSFQSPCMVPALLRQQHRHYEGSHRLARSSLPASPEPDCIPEGIAEGSSSDAATAGPNGRSDGVCSSFESVASGELGDGLAGAVPMLSQCAACETDGEGVLGTGDMSDKKGPKPVGALSIAAAAATVSAVITSAASGSLSSVSRVAAPSLTSTMAAGTALAGASAAVAPLSLLGLAAAAAVTLVTAAAVTHIRTGSPLQPLEGPYGVDALEAQPCAAPPLATGSETSQQETRKSSLSWLIRCRSGAVHRGKSNVGSALESNGSISAAASTSPHVAVVTATAVVGDETEDGDCKSMYDGMSVLGVSPLPGLVEECSCCDSNGVAGRMAPGDVNAAATRAAAASDSVMASSAEGGQAAGAPISSAWGSQPHLADDDAEQGTQHPQSVAQGQGVVEQQQQMDGEEEPLPLMLFSGYLDGIPLLVGSDSEEGVVQQQAEVLHGGELRPLPPPPAGGQGYVEAELDTVTPYGDAAMPPSPQPSRRNSALRQLFSNGDAGTVVDALDIRSTQQQQKLEAGGLEAAYVGASRSQLCASALPLGVGASAALAIIPPQAGSQVDRRRRVQLLTESPVRLLYSIHASSTVPSPGSLQMQPEQRSSEPRTASVASQQLANCNSSAQLRAPQVECAVRIEVDERCGLNVAGPSCDGDGDRQGDRSRNPMVAQPLAEGVVQQVFMLSVHEANSSGAAPGVAAGTETVQDGQSPPQACARDWHISSFGLAASSMEGARRRPSLSLATVESPACTWGCLSPTRSSLSAPPTCNATDGTPGCLRSLHSQTCAGLAFEVEPEGDGSWTHKEEPPLLGRDVLNGRMEAVATAPAYSGNSVNIESQAAAPSSYAGASPAANYLVAPLQGQRDVARPVAAKEQHMEHMLLREWQSEDVHLVIVDVPAASHARNGTELPALSPSISGASDNVPVSASVGSGLYTRMHSLANSSDVEALGECTHVAGAQNQQPAEPARHSRRNSDGSKNCPACTTGCSAAGSGGSPGGESGAAGDEEDLQQRLLEELTLSAEPPSLWPICASVIGEPGRSSSPIVSNVQVDSDRNRKGLDTSTAAAGPGSWLSDGSDAADDVVWLGSRAGIAAAGLSTTSAPDSPRIPLPPPLACSTTPSRGGSSAHSPPAESRGASQKAAPVESSEKAPLGDGRASRTSSSGSYRVPVEISTWREHCWSAHWPGHSDLQPIACSGDNQPVTPPSYRACGSSVDRLVTPHGPGWNEGAFGTSTTKQDAGGRSGNSCADPVGSCCDPMVSALVALRAIGWQSGAAGKVRGGGGGGGGANSSPPTGSPATPSHGALGAASSRATPVSPDLSDISSDAYARGMYTYGSPHGAQASDRAHAESETTPRDDLFHNPLYGPSGKDSPEKLARSRLQHESSGWSTLPPALYSEGRVYGRLDGNGYGTSTYASSTAPASVSQMSVCVDGGASGSRRWTREETAISSYKDDGGDDARDTVSERRAGSSEAWRLWVAVAAQRLLASRRRTEGSVGGARARSVAFTHEDAGGAEPQPSKRARTQLRQPETPASSPQGQKYYQQRVGQQQQPGTPVVRGLATPLMVLNPAYAQSAGGSPALTSSPSTTTGNAWSAPAASARTQRGGLLEAGGESTAGSFTASKTEMAIAAAGLQEDGCYATQMERYGAADHPVSPCVTPRNRELAQLQESDWGSAQGSPSSKQAVHAAALLRQANDAVDLAREAVQRGDTEWLSRVTVTLQTVQSALNALREF